MALPTNRPIQERVVQAYMADSGSSSSVYMAAPCKGYITKLQACLGSTTVGTANNVLTTFINGTAVTHDAWTQLTAGSAAGDVASANVSSANYCYEGDTIKVTSDGGGSNTTPTQINVIIQME